MTMRLALALILCLATTAHAAAPIDRDGVVRWSKTGYDEKWLDELAEPLVAAVNAKPGAAVASDES